MHDDDLYGVHGIGDEVLVWISQRNSSMPPSLFLFLFFSFSLFLFFWWPQWLFLFNSHLSSLGSFNLCPIWDLFLTLGQYSIFYKNKGDLSHFTKVLNIK